MKLNITFIYLFLISGLAVSQITSQIPILEKSGKYGFDKILSIEGKTAKFIYDSTKLFLIKKHADNSFIIDIENQEIYDNGSFPADFMVSNIPMTYTILYNVTTMFKEGKLKVIITDFKVSTNAQGTTSEVPLENFLKNMNSLKSGKKYAEKISDSLSNSIIEQVEKLISEFETNLASDKTEW